MKKIFKSLLVLSLLIGVGAHAAEHQKNELVDRLQTYWPKPFIYPECNKGYDFYQFETLRQGAFDCSFHTQWNRAHVYAIVSELVKEETAERIALIQKLFRHMYNRSVYKKFAVCCGQSSKENAYLEGLSQSKVNELIAKKILPKQCKNMNRDTVPFVYYNEKLFSWYDEKGDVEGSFEGDPEIMQRESVGKMMTDIEGVGNVEGNSSVRLCSSWLGTSPWTELQIPVKRVREFYKRSNDILCLIFCYRTMATHKTSLIICKRNGKCTFFFADSFRQPTIHPELDTDFVKVHGSVVKTVSSNFTAAFEVTKLLFLNKDLFEDSLVRHVCVDLFKNYCFKGSTKRMLLALGKFKKYGLLENDCFKKYYRSWLIKKLQDETVQTAAEVFSEIISGMNKEKIEIKKINRECQKKSVDPTNHKELLEKLDCAQSCLKKGRTELSFCSEGLKLFKQLKS